MSTAPADNDDEGSGEAARKLQLVHAGLSEFGIFVEEISAIVAWQKPTPLPHAPKAVLGVVTIDGRMLTVLDLTMLSGDEEELSNALRDTAYLIALRGDEQLALAADAIGEIIVLTPDGSTTDSVATAETVTKPVLGVVRCENTEIKILNPKGLFPTAIQGRQRRNRSF